MNYTSISVVNIINYRGHVQGDPAAYKKCKSRFSKQYDIPASIETTHGIVRMIVKKYLKINLKLRCQPYSFLLSWIAMNILAMMWISMEYRTTSQDLMQVEPPVRYW